MQNYIDYVLDLLHQRGSDGYIIRYDEFIWQNWYFCDADLQKQTPVIQWTQSLSRAYTFDRHIDAAEFARDFISPRGIEIISLTEEIGLVELEYSI